MRIAIAEEGNQVSGHFGHCSQFLLADIENGLVMKRAWIDNPAHVPGKLPLFLEEQGVSVIIAGAMGQMARQLFDARGIDQIVGVTGSVDKALEDFITGSLEQGENLCSGGHHNGGGHNCGGH